MPVSAKMFSWPPAEASFDMTVVFGNRRFPHTSAFPWPALLMAPGTSSPGSKRHQALVTIPSHCSFCGKKNLIPSPDSHSALLQLLPWGALLGGTCGAAEQRWPKPEGREQGHPATPQPSPHGPSGDNPKPSTPHRNPRGWAWTPLPPPKMAAAPQGGVLPSQPRRPWPRPEGRGCLGSPHQAPWGDLRGNRRKIPLPGA